MTRSSLALALALAALAGPAACKPSVPAQPPPAAASGPEQILAGLGNCIFLMNNVHEDRPVLSQTRWTLSYLRSIRTRDGIRYWHARDPGCLCPADQRRAARSATAICCARPDHICG